MPNISMIYSAYQAQAQFMRYIRIAAGQAAISMEYLPAFAKDMMGLQAYRAGLAMLGRAGLSHSRPPFNIPFVDVGNAQVAVVEEVAHQTPFASLLHFKKDTDQRQPRVLVVAPLSGHFATLLKNTVEVLLPENDVYITDWHNARDIPAEAGRFGFDEYIDHVVEFLEVIGPGSHLLAVCQPCAHAFAAVAVMAQTNNPAQPRSMTLMAGPIDCRINPTSVNKLATEHPISWFEKNLIAPVAPGLPGAGRLVYPGFLQLTAFMSMNPNRHVKAHIDMFANIARGDVDKALIAQEFYDEYFAVLDLTAEFYLETVQKVFQEYHLPRGILEWRGQKVDPGAIRRTALLTVEGERDDICAVGQTLAAQDLATGIKPFRKRHHLQAGVGHYGVFSGSRWRKQIYPLVRNTILAHD
jgi:polyhydroxyalkanoate depolymerase